MHSRSVGIRQAYRIFSLFISLLTFAAICASQEPAPGEPQPDSHEASSRALPGNRYVPGRLLVVLDPETSATERAQVFAGRGARSVGGDARLGFHIVELPPRADESAALRAFRNHPRVLAAELDEIVEHAQITPNDPSYPAQAHLRAIQGPAAWLKTTGSPSVIVAIIDTGVNPDHPDLAGRLLPGWNTYDNNANSADVYGHGTKVAGTITAATDNGLGVASICWNCMLLPVRASYPSGSASYSTLAAGLMWAADHGARVANISYSISSSTTVTLAAQYFMQRGGLVFSSAGNYGVNDPAADNPYIVTVSALDPASNNLYSWSNYGNNIDVTAPGCAGATTLMSLTYGSGCGTSYSSPIAAGVAALIFSANPALSPEAALAILKQSSTDLGEPGWDARFGAGFVNAAAAVALAAGESAADTRGPQVSSISPASGTSAKGSLAASATVSDVEGTVESVTFQLNSTNVCVFAAPPYVCSIDTTRFPDGAATFAVAATDNSGNTTTVQNSFTIANADTVKPVVSLTSPAPGTLVDGIVTVSFSASDDVGVSSIVVTAGGAVLCSVAGSATSCPWDTGKLPDGPVQVSVTARDAAGNAQTASATVVVAHPDLVPPSVAILAPSEGATVKGPVVIAFNVTDNVGVTSTVVAANGATLCSVAGPASACSWNTSLAANGAYTITVTASDAAGNVRAGSLKVTVANPSADTTRPAVAILAPGVGAAVTGTVRIAFSATDDTGVTAITVTVGAQTICSVAGSATACYWTSPQTPNGPAAITVSARDAAGNTAVATRAVTVRNGDFTAPTVAITSPAAAAKLSGTVAVSFKATDAVGVTGITVAAGTVALCSLPGAATSCVWDTTKTPNGSYILSVSARDAAGNSRTASLPVTVDNSAADTVSPVVSFVSPVAGAAVNGPVTIGFTSSDNRGVVRVVVSVNAIPICTLNSASGSFSWNPAFLPAGPTTLVATAYDAAGNAGTARITINVVKYP